MLLHINGTFTMGTLNLLKCLCGILYLTTLGYLKSCSELQCSVSSATLQITTSHAGFIFHFCFLFLFLFLCFLFCFVLFFVLFLFFFIKLNVIFFLMFYIHFFRCTKCMRCLRVNRNSIFKTFLRVFDKTLSNPNYLSV